MARRRFRSDGHFNVWPVVADTFLALLAVVVVMASGRQPADTEVDKLKAEIVERSHHEYAGLLAEVELGSKWARLVLTEDSLSFPKCEWGLPTAKQDQIHTLFQWIGERRQLLRQIRIEGHADRKWMGEGCENVGPFLDNLQLSQNRARAVYNVLLGFAPEARTGLQEFLNSSDDSQPVPDGLEYLRDLARRGCIEIAGYGDRHPLDRTDLDSAKNRRVEVVLEFREPPAGSASSQETGTGVCEASK